MYFATYKTTLKSLLRSILLWMGIIIVFCIVINQVSSVNLLVSVVENGKIVKQITDTDPEFVLEYDKYIQTILNCSRSWVMLYAVPLLCVISSMLILNRNYGDGFYEIEKSNNLRPSIHLFGRISAILTINIVVCLVITFVAVNYYYFSRGGVQELSLFEYFSDCTIRIFRVFITSMLFGILFYTGLTYLIGSIFKNGISGAILGFAYVLWEYCTETVMRLRLPDLYHNYLSTKSLAPYVYWTYYDTEWFNEKMIYNPYTGCQIMLWTGIMVTCVSMFVFISYICTKKRTI